MDKRNNLDLKAQPLLSVNQHSDTEAQIDTLKHWLKRVTEVKDIFFIHPGNEAAAGSELNDVFVPLQVLERELNWPIPASLIGQDAYGHIIQSEEGKPIFLMLFRARSEQLAKYKLEIDLVANKLKDILESNFIKERINRLEAFTDVLFEANIKKLSEMQQRGLDLLIDVFSFPLYIAGKDGRFIHVNQAFLNLVKYPSLSDLNNSVDLFVEPEKRKNEFQTILNRGEINNYSLQLRTGEGRLLDVSDSIINITESFILGVFFDITELARLNRKNREALEIQELLNDRIIAAAELLQKTQSTSIKSLARLAEYRDAETGDHLQRICEFTGLLARKVKEKNPFTFKINDSYVSDLYISSMLHDIGKVAVPDSILLKPGKLLPEEWDIMKQHTVWGWAILSKADKEMGEQSFLTLAAALALHHHERFDGSGYPHSLAGQDIPLSARIVAIADVYDALTSKRPYKEAWPHELAIQEIKIQRGKQFCPVLAGFFCEAEIEIARIAARFSD
ncbi:MAG TPA: HD domain-containing protein [Spirochaetales bacterium]|nr:HD domain-containing protein [Spirochaetales bacterium]